MTKKATRFKAPIPKALKAPAKRKMLSVAPEVHALLAKHAKHHGVTIVAMATAIIQYHDANEVL